MKILVTAGATMTPIDKVRAITNIFHGRTGTEIAKHFALDSGNQVTLMTSNPDLIYNDQKFICVRKLVPETFLMRFLTRKTFISVIPYKTYDELRDLMASEIRFGHYDLIIHSAAVSDYTVSQVMVREGAELKPVDNSKKISSKHDKMYLELVPTEKLIDKIRRDWGFKGQLVKFKLQVGMSDEKLIRIATKSMSDSESELIVANCLEWSKEYAYVIGKDGRTVKVNRQEIAAEIERRLK